MTTTDRTPGWYRFGLFEVDERRGEVRKRGLRIRLRGRPFDILLILLERPGELISREDLRARLWTADTFVDFDHGVNTAVNRLREVLGDSADNPRFIETVPRKGYRFIAPVDVLTVREPLAVAAVVPAGFETPAQPPPEPASSPTLEALHNVQSGVRSGARSESRRLDLSAKRLWLAGALAIAAIAGVAAWLRLGATAAPGGQMRLAVLPFENLSGDPDQEFFSDGFTEELIAELGALKPNRFGVIARTTSMRYKGTLKDVGQIRAELGVDYVLEGSVRRAGDRLRITAQLVETRNQTNLWAESYDREVSDVIGIQTDVAMAIAKSLGPTLNAPAAIERSAAPSSFAAYRVHAARPFFPRAGHRGEHEKVDRLLRACDRARSHICACVRGHRGRIPPARRAWMGSRRAGRPVEESQGGRGARAGPRSLLCRRPRRNGDGALHVRVGSGQRGAGDQRSHPPEPESLEGASVLFRHPDGITPARRGDRRGAARDGARSVVRDGRYDARRQALVRGAKRGGR